MVLAGASQVAKWVKNPPAMRERGDVCSVPYLGRSFAEGHSNPL